LPRHRGGSWQQDRWTFGGARGVMTGVWHDGGETWRRTFAHFTRCAGGTAANNGNYERASDPWVTISPNGIAHQIALSFDFVDDTHQAILVSSSSNEGDGWTDPIAVLVDTDPTLIDDKETITADPLNSRFVYAVWDRLEFTDATQTVLTRGPTVFSRTITAAEPGSRHGRSTTLGSMPRRSRTRSSSCPMGSGQSSGALPARQRG